MDALLRILHLDLFSIGATPITPLSLIGLIVIVTVSIYLSQLVRRVIKRVLLRRGGVPEGAAYAIGRVAQYAVLIGGIVFGLDNIGFDITTLAAFGAVLSVGIGFGLQNIAQNFISGLILLIERPVQKGDFIVLGDTVGSVVAIEMRATRLITRDGVSVLVPNSRLIAEEVRNLSAPTTTTRIRVDVGVAYGSETALVRRVLLDVASAHEKVLAEPAPLVLFQSFGESSLAFQLCVWLDDPQLIHQLASDLRFAIDAAFRANHIAIPFPQRDLHLVSGFDHLSRPLEAGDDRPGQGAVSDAGDLSS